MLLNVAIEGQRRIVKVEERIRIEKLREIGDLGKNY